MNIFMNPDENRLRSGWRLAAQLFLTYLMFVIFTWVLSRFITIGNQMGILIFAGCSMISIGLAVRGMDYRPWSDLGLGFNNQYGWECAIGCGIAASAMAVIFLIELGAGWVTISGFGWQQSHSQFYFLTYTSYFFFMVIVGFYEELLFRGYQIVNLSEGFNLPQVGRKQAVIGSVIFSSLVFAAAHAFNPNASWISTINIALAGVMLALPFIISGRLSLSIGLHIGWNFAQGGIFGFPVSGLPSHVSFIQISQTGPDWITGGGFGPEGGMMGLFGIALVILLTYVYFNRKEQLVDIAPGIGVYKPLSRRYPA